MSQRTSKHGTPPTTHAQHRAASRRCHRWFVLPSFAELSGAASKCKQSLRQPTSPASSEPSRAFAGKRHSREEIQRQRKRTLKRTQTSNLVGTSEPSSSELYSPSPDVTLRIGGNLLQFGFVPLEINPYYSSFMQNVE